MTDAEYKALEALAKKCRGYTPKTAAKALDEAMRSAGYLMLFGRRAKDAALVMKGRKTVRCWKCGKKMTAFVGKYEYSG